MPLLKSIQKADDLYTIIRLTQNQFGVSEYNIHYYKEDFSEVKSCIGFYMHGDIKWNPVPENEKSQLLEDLKKEFPELNQKVKINLEINSKTTDRTEYTKWTEKIGDEVNHQTGTTWGVTIYDKTIPSILVKLDRPFNDPTCKNNMIYFYHFDKTELIFKNNS